MAFANDTKPSSTFVNDRESRDQGFLLKEDTFYLLLETGFKIIINVQDYTNDTEPSSLIYSLETKPS